MATGGCRRSLVSLSGAVACALGLRAPAPGAHQARGLAVWRPGFGERLGAGAAPTPHEVWRAAAAAGETVPPPTIAAATALARRQLQARDDADGREAHKHKRKQQLRLRARTVFATMQALERRANDKAARATRDAKRLERWRKGKELAAASRAARAAAGLP